jgi:hypothetical protein
MKKLKNKTRAYYSTMVQRYKYPEKVDEENLKSLIERAKEIAHKSSITFGVSGVLSLARALSTL